MTPRTRSVAALLMTALLVCSSVGVAAAQSSATPQRGPAVNAQAQMQSADSYVVEQGDTCRQIRPLSTNGTVGAFYDYRNHETHPEGVDRLYSSYGTTHLQEENTSVLFLHRGTDGLSLVAVHGHLEGETAGGVASFDIVGVPNETEWVVQDDLYDGESNMAQWHRGDGWIGADWIWSESRTDGGAIRGGLNGEFALTVQPAFNEDSPFYENESLYDPDFYGDGEVEDWEVLSGDADDPERSSLSLEEPVTIRTGTCDDPSVTYERTDGGIAATIDGATANDQIALQPTSGTNENVTFERVAVSGLDDGGSVTFANDRPDGLLASPEGVDSLSHLTMDGESTEDASATVTFSVTAAELEARGLEADDIALYEADNESGEWTQVETTVAEESATEYRYTAEVSSLEAVTVAESRTDTESGSSSMPGFEIGATLGALAVLTALWAARGRER
ncbi:PGF-pre-PGF domain-containing protein [Halopiger aswanensis]|uniref:PGF-pre-PGF domain-containing protein n=1 Tax=Halopiger aswanensis TaxID=148449 RepID=A0A3R7EGZ6_9EURY|nr:PGF-pre-PGF domain-containing protein [Halopiger aswanensis]RKD97407.1 PGF-pre-PGF domain-containing protein [Halopiger aswanensis]